MKSLLNYWHKDLRFLYYLRHLAMLVEPRHGRYRRRNRWLNEAAMEDETVQSRVDYYHRLSSSFTLPPAVEPFQFHFWGGRRNYNFDLYAYTRYFPNDVHFLAIFGDITEVPPYPALVKARPIQGENRNSILFNLNRIRHFVFAHDHLPYVDKRDQLVWRGNASQQNRQTFLSRFYRHPRCDVGHSRRGRGLREWSRPFLTIGQQLQYKFILSLEGNDVASNLKWIMSSQSLCFMPRPRYETWFMEGELEAGKHYVEIRNDFDDLDEKMDYYLARPGEAREIIRHANEYVAQFRYPHREDLVSLLVLKKYADLSGQRY